MPELNVEELTLKQIRELTALTGVSAKKTHSIMTGEKYFIRTVTNYYTGKVRSVTDSDIVLDDAAWIPDTGRFADALKTGKMNEVEPYVGVCIVNRDTIIDMSPWGHELPRAQK